MNRHDLYLRTIKAKDNKYEKKRKRRNRLYHNRSLKKKSFTKIEGQIKPIEKWCLRCGNHRVKFHHKFCNGCWEEIKKQKEQEIINVIK